LTDLKKKHADYITRFERLDYNHEVLKARNIDAEDALEKMRSSQDDDQAEIIIKNLQRQLQESNDLIANQEQQLDAVESTKRQQSKELLSLRADSKRVVALDDEVRELKNENALLTRKANRADHFEKKIESLVSTQKDNEKLKETNEVLMANMKEWDQVHAELARLQNSVQRYQNMHANQELDIVELERRIKIYQQDISKQKDELEILKAQKDNDERFYADAIEELRAGQTRSPDSPSTTRLLTLDQELEQSGDPVPNYMLEISRLKAENQLLKSNTGGTTNASLRIELEEADRIKKHLEERYQKLTEEHTIVEKQLSAIIGNSSGEKLVKIMDRLMSIGPIQILTDDFYRDQAINTTRRLYLEANNELSAVKSQLAQLQVDMSSRDRELLSAKADRKSDIQGIEYCANMQ
jgi:protein HOOK3